MASHDAFTDITILFAADASLWCTYLAKSFRTEQTKTRLEHLNVSTLVSKNPPELQVAIRESHVVMLLVSDEFLTFMETNSCWLSNLLQSRDSILTSIFAVCLCVGHDDLFDSAVDFGFDLDSWDEFELSEDGSNVTSLVSRALEHVDNNCLRLSRKRRLTKKRAAASQMAVQLVPASAPPAGEKAALIFTDEVKGSLAVHMQDVTSEPLSLNHVNPYCVTFVTPDVGEEVIHLIITENGLVKHCMPWPRVNQTCQFSSVELLCQAHSVNNKCDLDLALTQQFEQSQSPDVNSLTQYLRDSLAFDARKSVYPSMLHWAAANGMQELGAAILSTPAGSSLGRVLNSEGLDPAALARANGCDDLAEYIVQTLETEAIAEACKIYVDRVHTKPQTQNPVAEDYEVMKLPVHTTPLDRLGPSGHMTSATTPPHNYLKNAPPPVPKRKRPSTSSTEAPSESESVYDTPETGAPSESESFYNTPETVDPVDQGESTYMEPDPVLPPGSGGSRGQGELISIQKDVKHGTFTISEAESLFNAWKDRHQSGCSQSFKQKKSTLTTLRNEYNPTLKAVREVGKTDEALGPLPSISNPIRTAKDQRDSKISEMSTTSTDSGIVPEDTSSDSSLQPFACEVVHRRPGRLSDKSKLKRSSVKDLYLQLLDSGPLDVTSDRAPPALPPRPKKRTPRVYSKTATLPNNTTGNTFSANQMSPVEEAGKTKARTLPPPVPKKKSK